MQNKNKIKYNRGAAMMTVVFFFMFISLTILIGVITPVVREFKIISDSLDSKQSYFTAESGVEDIIYRIKNNMETDTSETLIIDNSSTTTTITDISSSQKEIISLGDTNSIQRKVNTIVNTGLGVSFSYGILTGSGGLLMDNHSEIIGSVYSNGNITGSGSISGSATSANPPSLSADQTNGSGTPPYDVTFGNASGTQDFAQSFQVSTTGLINKVQLYIKRVSTPSNITVRIVTDSSGKPSTNTLTSASLASSLISTNYSWIEVPFSSHPQLTSGVTYWIVLDASTSSSKYYKIGANNNGYVNGIGKIGQYGGTWNNTSPSGRDGFFKLYLGGLTGLIQGITVGTGSVGNTYAHEVSHSYIQGTNYCKIGHSNDKDCDPSRDDPVQIAMPISEQNILDWKNEVEEANDIHSGNLTISTNTTAGPKKITGNLTINGGVTLTLGGTIWVQGNLVMANSSKINLVAGYGSSEGIIIVDGTITINNYATFAGSGTDGSYVLALSTSSSSTAIQLEQHAGAVALYASNGTIVVAQHGTAKSLTGYYIHLNEHAVIEYDDGLANANFISGPSGSWNISNWAESE